MENEINYWFTVEPFVYIGMTKNHALLYNTLDGMNIESDKIEVLQLLHEVLQEENCGVALLTHERYKQKDINDFIKEVREKYMCDIIDVALSIGKPVQLLPYYNFPDKHDVYKKNSFLTSRKILEYLTEISIHVDQSINITNLILFLQSLPGNITFNIVGNLANVANHKDLLSFLDLHDSPKNLCCSYSDVISLQSISKSSFSYIISVHFPIDIKKWNHSRQLLIEQSLPITYIFDVLSLDDCQQAEELVEQFQIENYRLNPVYTEDNIDFFKQNVFLTKKDILSSSISIKTFFANQSINIHDFGKINIMPNGDAYANLNYPTLGNINMHSIHEIVDKEIKEGISWFRIRNQAPCNECVYQWMCPSPSNYEISIGKPNLCHVKTMTNQ